MSSLLLAVAITAPQAPSGPAADYTKQVVPILTRYCVGCHNDEDREGDLSLETWDSLQHGGGEEPLLLPGQSKSSRLIRVLTGEAEPKMPPEDNPGPTETEIAVLRAWIDGGARGPTGRQPRPQLVTPVIPRREGVAQAVTALAWSPHGSSTAVGRFGELALFSDQDTPLWSIGGLPGKVNSVRYSADGTWIAVATGIGGLSGEAVIYDTKRGLLVRKFGAHRDILYAAVLSPSRELLATAGYDRRIMIWNTSSGELVRTLDGHNGAIYDLDFSADGKLLASASADETIKVWHVATGQRLDTRSEPLAEQYAVRFSPDDKFLVGSGADNRIRVWRVVSREAPQINPLVQARFAHEGPVTHLRFSGDGSRLVSVAEDRTMKLWETQSWTPVRAFERQSAIVSALAMAPTGKRMLVGRMDGTTHVYPIDSVSAAASNITQGLDEKKPVPDTTPALSQSEEAEPNDTPGDATVVTAPFTVAGRIHSEDDTRQDRDLFRFASRQGQEWIIEVKAARSKSPLDSRIAVLTTEGQAIPRVQLRAVRDSYFTFRGKDSSTSDDFRLHNWREMELNEYLYAGGEVVRLWLYPRGPDSGYKVYPGRGKRYGFFDTTPTAHALHAPCYIVEAHPPGTEFLPNGLPVFTLNYENDDDSRRKLGSDSRLTFRAPSDGDYIVQVTDTRGFSGEDYSYELTVRPPAPSFRVTLNGANPTVNAGSGREFHVVAERLDGFTGPIRVDIDGVPPGFHVTSPVVIQAGQEIAFGTLSADPDAPAPTDENKAGTQIRATASINGQDVTADVNNFGEIKLTAKPKLRVLLTPTGADPASLNPDKPLELTIAPGETITATVRIERNGFKGRVDFGKDDSGRNLPHGVYVDNIGLNGLMIVEGQTQREFFITAAKWVPETTRLFHLRATAEGGQTSLPLRLHVRAPAAKTATTE